jgi:hypothetical protein
VADQPIDWISPAPTPDPVDLISDRLEGMGGDSTNKEDAVVPKRFLKFLPPILLIVAFAALPAVAGPMPSKTAANQSIDSRTADLALLRDVAAGQQVARVLASHGFTQEQVNQRLAQLSPQDLHSLAQNLQQVQAAGMTRQEWIWIGTGAVAALILIVALS